MQSQRNGFSGMFLLCLGGFGAFCIFKFFTYANQSNSKSYRHGGGGMSVGGFTPAYADQYSPVNTIGRKYVDVDSRLAVKVSKQIKKEKNQKPSADSKIISPSGGIKKETEE